jgi:hypothetical protein
MKIFYALATILLLSLQSKSQDRNPGEDPAPAIVKFYPNPATSIITFDFQRGYDKSLNLQIFNFIGKKVQEINNITPKTTVNLNDFYRGIYIFQLKDKNGKVIASRLFEDSQKLDRLEPAVAVAGFNDAFGRLARQLIVWTVQSL